MGECTSNSIHFVPLSMGDFFDELNDQMRRCAGGYWDRYEMVVEKGESRFFLERHPKHLMKVIILWGIINSLVICTAFFACL
jgi:hypothetical protein